MMTRTSPIAFMLDFAGCGLKPPVRTADEAANEAHAGNDAALQALAAAALAWWEAQRPPGWSLGQHLQEPAVQCRTGDEALAAAVARWVSHGR